MVQTNIVYTRSFVVLHLELIFVGWGFFSCFLKKINCN